ncbi:hypothetical protein [Pseudomonas cichorii]|uniref:hypothetical protein n=1 Tax=Pseudomonas cichorii TaxID=36746 RepID=UPI001C8A9FD5|nr:hypothetical protein [Pseudomonas cichorii]MBX8496001.1 hypothetical protein [Pseudomonas cichorii]
MDIEVVSVHGHGDASEEYVKLKVLKDCSLVHYALIDSTYDGSTLTDKNRHFYWFPKRDVKAGDLITLYTRVGKKSRSTVGNGEHHYLYWGLKSAVWNDSGDAATLLQVADWKAKTVK